MFYLQAQKNLFVYLLPLHFLPSTGHDVQSCLTQLLLPLASSPQLIQSLTNTTFPGALGISQEHKHKDGKSMLQKG